MYLHRLALLLTLSWTNPSWNGWTREFVPDTSSVCDQAPIPLTDLREVRVYGFWSGGHETVLLTRKDETHREGAPDSVQVVLPHPADLWTLIVVAADSAGNESCAQTTVVNATTDVEHHEHRKEPVTWYDVAGRKVQEPHTPGIYLRKQGREVTKVAVLR